MTKTGRDDLISRKAAKEKFNDIPPFIGMTGGCVQQMLDDIPAVEVEPVRHGCEYCSGAFAEYQHTINTKLYINTFGKARTLETECNSCPPYARCSMNGIPVRSAFIINYCPNCGRKLDGDCNG